MDVGAGFQVKKVLSTNTQIPVSMSSLHDGVDLSTTVTRAAFEETSKHLLERVSAPIDAALEQAGMTLADIKEVEVIGGGGRIPKASFLGSDGWWELLAGLCISCRGGPVRVEA